MAKESGIGFASFAIDDDGGAARDIVNDILNTDWDHPRETIDVTGMNKSAHERLIGLGDFSINLTAAFNDGAAPTSYETFKNAGTTDVARTSTITISAQILATEIWLTSVVLARAADASFQYSVSGVLQDGTGPIWTT
jgi:hypothetical protein|tara:strand:+ start:216 stop:629 length:414 start_codon:yes stop_codon:yes gene_type:complete